MPVVFMIITVDKCGQKLLKEANAAPVLHKQNKPAGEQKKSDETFNQLYFIFNSTPTAL